MQLKRIKVDQWYQTRQGIGKCLTTWGKHVKFEIDGKEVLLSSSDVQHEIAEGQEPQQQLPEKKTDAVGQFLDKQRTDAAYIGHLEDANRELREALEECLECMVQADDETNDEMSDLEIKIRRVLKKAKGRAP